MTDKPLIGRPTIYTEELAAEVCNRISQGESLNKVCQDKQLPTRSTINLWLIDGVHEQFSENYRLARAQQMDYFADEMLTIADQAGQDAEIKYTKSGNPYISENWQSVNRAKCRIGTRQWLMGKFAPTKYGDRTEQTINVIHHKEIAWDQPKRLEHEQRKLVANEAPMPSTTVAQAPTTIIDTSAATSAKPDAKQQ